ncbi:MAG: Arc family DNA-binding protein [Candidatus Thiodiazotropha sp.]
MASFIIKNIPDDLYEHLKQAANAHHRSVNSELIYCLERTLLPTKLTPTDLKTTAKLLRDRVMTDRIDADEINTAKNEGRA